MCELGHRGERKERGVEMRVTDRAGEAAAAARLGAWQAGARPRPAAGVRHGVTLTRTWKYRRATQVGLSLWRALMLRIICCDTAADAAALPR